VTSDFEDDVLRIFGEDSARRIFEFVRFHDTRAADRLLSRYR